MTRCARCDWRPIEDDDLTDKAQLALHALESEHPLCPCCSRSLRDTDPRHGCEHCLTYARELLSGIVTLYAELPLHLGRSTGTLPGGDPLVMLAAGSEGLAESGDTTRASDPPSVSFELGWWAMGWRDQRGDDSPDTAVLWLTGSPARVVANASRYLEIHARWAATSHTGFPDFLTDLKRLHRRLEIVTSHDLPEERANADCFDCGGKLVRKADPNTGVFDIEGPVECRNCHHVYDPSRYRLALRKKWESEEEWLPLTAAARLVGARVETVETWAKRMHVESCCRVEDGRKLVWWPDVRQRQYELEQAREERARRREEAMKAAS